MRLRVPAWVLWLDADVGLRLRVVIERDRQLRIDLPGGAQHVAKHGCQATNGGGVPAALRLPHDEEPVEKLEAFLRREHTERYQAIVLDARPASGLGKLLSHRRRHRTRTVASPARPVNVRGPAHLSRAAGRA